MLWPKGNDGGPEPLAWGVGTSKMAMTGRAETHHGGPVRAGMVTMAVPRQEAVRAQLLDEAIDHLLRGEEPALEVNDELSALVEVARLRYRLSRYLQGVAAQRQEAVWGQVRSRIGPPPSRSP